MSDTSSKTEKPTPKRLKEARKEGRIPRSPELSGWAALLVASFLLTQTIRRGATFSTNLMQQVGRLVADPDSGAALRLWGHGMRGALGLAAPLVLGLMALGVVGAVAQGGLHPTSKALKPKFSRLNPLSGLKRLLGPQGLWEAGKTLAKLAVLGWLAYRAVRGIVPALATSGALPLSAVLATTAAAALSLVRNVALAGLLIAAADYGYQRHTVMKSLRMSRQDIKDEHKQADGDPKIKGAIRERQMRLSRNRMMADVATADVVVVNPTHVAVALVYEPDKGAPRVVAKGAGVIATRIREEADKHRVPMVRDVPLARTLFRACDIGAEIPPELYGAVARVLAFIFSLRSRGSAAGLHTAPPLPA